MDRPLYFIEDRVKLLRDIRNDGTFPGADKGEILIAEGEEGEVINLGTFLLDKWIYSVIFKSGKIIGCLGSELELVERGRYYEPPVY
jgi:nitrogen fixation protein NifZ